MKHTIQNKRKKLTVLCIFLVLIISVLPIGINGEEAAVQEPAAEAEEAVDAGAKPAEESAPAPAEEAPTAQTAAQAGEVLLYPITATKKAAENSNYELYIDEASGNIRIVDKRSGNEWLGSPRADRKTTLPNNKKFMDAPIHITYTDGSSISQTYSLKEKENTLAFTEIENGVRVDFGIEEIKLYLSLEYKLTEDGFTVSIPDDSIREEGTVRLTRLEVLPFFHAVSETLDEGAVFLPDGSGALMTVKAKHPTYFSGYSQPVYGGDHAFKEEVGEVLVQGYTLADVPKERIALPVFGIYQAGTGFLAIITDGDETAYINATPGGVRNIPFYRAGAEFVYRSQDVIYIGSSGKIPLFQGQRTNADREIKFILLEDEEAHYVGMANAYRNYLQVNHGLAKQEGTEAPLHIELVGGILRDEIIGSTFISMTTFEQAKEMIESYAEKGIKELKITFKGWSKDGLYGNQPSHFPVESKLGGMKKLEELAAFAMELGVDLFLDANYVRPFQEGSGVSVWNDVIRGIDRQILDSPNYYVSNRISNNEQLFYLVRPDRALRFAEKEIDNYQEAGVAGVHVSHVGELLYSDKNPNHLFSREETKQAWVELVDRLKASVGKVSVDYGNAYTLGHVDAIHEIPMDSSHFVYLDETVPFYQIVIHGMIPYSGEPANLRDDAKVELLRQIEYGAIPSFELTYEPTEKLKRTMEDRLFSSSFSYWFDRSVEEYKAYQEIAQHTNGQLIVGHEKVQTKVYRTTYENGTEVVVNYNPTSRLIDGEFVEGLSYTVREGDRQ